jgi:N6-L-threonylcarbamoyladenine synthase
MPRLQEKSNGVKILAIESSCDDSGIAILEYSVQDSQPKMLANLISSQVKVHAKWGGVVPMLAKREHQKNLAPLLIEALKNSNLLLPEQASQKRSASKTEKIRPFDSAPTALRSGDIDILKKILEREPELLKKLLPFLKKYQRPDVDYIAVTHGPGLEPALWVGINLAKALSFVWDLPILPINHIEGHLTAAFAVGESRGISKSLASSSMSRSGQFPMTNENQELNKDSQKLKTKNQKLFFPAMCLVVSGGHTQLILIKSLKKPMSSLSGTHSIPVSPAGETLASIRPSRSGPPFAQTHVSPGRSPSLDYQIIGETRDDAAGEAFDKVAKMLNLGYPGGPAISKQAAKWNDCSAAQSLNHSITEFSTPFSFPRPMINSGDFDFSFSGLKTAVLYTLQKMTKAQIKKATPAIAAAFEQAVVDVLVQKTINAAKKYGTKSIWLAGGVAANQALRQSLEQAARNDDLGFLVPPSAYCADNAGMIALAAFYQIAQNRAGKTAWKDLKAEPNLRIS